ncbi:deaminase [Nocardioides silvaticus]|uniref:Deaminase n=1 Tax=Nocardioides silvaticus TaxID=2201891 RepID=A0A316TAE9_9ACTN|nr:dihydrofolate reductase family protein [Nocardioides silvaticus]PWN01217.1 deaminase [Nocardioides silvaticus]
MTATYTWDVFSTVDGWGSYAADGVWGGYWSKDGPEFLAHRLAAYDSDVRVVLGSTTFREMAGIFADLGADNLDEANRRIFASPVTVVSSTLRETRGWPNATIHAGGAADLVRRLKAENDVPLRSHGSLSLNRSLMAAGLVDFVQLTIFPVISGRTGTDRVFHDTEDFDLELVSSRTFDGRSQELVFVPTRH